MSASGDAGATLASLLVAAVLEEIVFRVGVQDALLHWMSRFPFQRTRVLGISAANLLTAILFGLLHGLLRSWALGVAVIIPALLLGWIYERWRRVWPCIAAHTAMNLIWFLAGLSASARMLLVWPP